MKRILAKSLPCIFLMYCLVSFAEVFGQETEENICELPDGQGSSQLLKANRDFTVISSSANFPYYPLDATLKALVIFVKFSDDNFDLPPLIDE